MVCSKLVFFLDVPGPSNCGDGSDIDIIEAVSTDTNKRKVLNGWQLFLHDKNKVCSKPVSLFFNSGLDASKSYIIRFMKLNTKSFVFLGKK